jgi:hypothetical protein
VISSNAAKSAAKTQSNAATAASNQQMDMFNAIRGDLSQYRDIGTAATPGYMKLLGIDSGGAYTSGGLTGGAAGTGGQPDWNDYLTRYKDVQAAYDALDPATKAQFPTAQDYAKFHYQNFGQRSDENRTINMTPSTGPVNSSTGPNGEPLTAIEAQLQSLPGYQFQRDQGVSSVNRALGTKGLTGAQAKGIARFVTGLADSTYGEQVNRMKDAVTIGQNSAAQTGTFGQTAATNSGNALIGGANATAAGQVGGANAISGGISNGINSALLTNKLLGGSGGSGGIYGTSLANSGNYYSGLYGGGQVPY